MSRDLAYLGISLVAVFWSLSQSSPQVATATEIAAPAACSKCDLRLERVVALRDDVNLNRPIVGTSTSVVRDAAGRIFLIHNDDPSRIQIFEANGDYIRSLGSQGQGPGQFTAAAWLILDARGNLYVFDSVIQRMTVFSPAFDVLETRSFPQRLRILGALLLNEGFVVAGLSYREDSVGYPLHLLTRDLQITRSFGATDQTARPDMRVLQLRSIAKGTGGRIWSAPLNKYVIEEWEPADGTLHRAFVRDVNWFTPWYVGESISFETPPQPVLRSIWQDGGGLLWVLATVGAEDWRDALYVGDDQELVVLDRERLNDTFIEVIEPSTGRLLFSKKVPQELVAFTNDGLMVGNTEDETGPVVDLWRATLVR